MIPNLQKEKYGIGKKFKNNSVNPKKKKRKRNKARKKKSQKHRKHETNRNHKVRQNQSPNISKITINICGGFPGGAVVENLPANAGDTGSSPGLGRSHMPRSNWAREPQLLSLRVCSLCSATREAAIVRGPRAAMKSGPHLPQLEKSPRTETKTQHSHK